jgi:hypothetical protein
VDVTHAVACGHAWAESLCRGFVVGYLNVGRGLLAAYAAAWWRRSGGGSDGCQGLARGASVGARAGARECVPFCDTFSLE